MRFSPAGLFHSEGQRRLYSAPLHAQLESGELQSRRSVQTMLSYVGKIYFSHGSPPTLRSLQPLCYLVCVFATLTSSLYCLSQPATWSQLPTSSPLKSTLNWRGTMYILCVYNVHANNVYIYIAPHRTNKGKRRTTINIQP